MTLTEHSLRYWRDGEEVTEEVRGEEHFNQILKDDFGIVL